MDEEKILLMLAKAAEALAAAKLMLDAGYYDSCANRSYYAMFDSARAALLAVLDDEKVDEISKSHSGVIGAFGRYIVKSNLATGEIGRYLNRGQEVRHEADYGYSSIDRDAAASTYQKSVVFHAKACEIVGNAIPSIFDRHSDSPKCPRCRQVNCICGH